MEQERIINEVAKELELIIDDRHEITKQLLIEKINDLVTNDFQKLVSILYRMDVSEKKLRLALDENPETDSGKIIADLMIERQLQKIKSRQETKRNNNIPDEEKW